MTFFRIPVTCWCSSMVRGTSLIRNAANTAAATTPSMDRPRPRPGVARVVLELAHPVELLPLFERDRVAPGVLRRERDDGREARGPCDDAPRRPRPGEPLVLLRGVRGPFGALVDCALAHDEPAGVAHELASRVVPHEVLAPALRAGTLFVDDRLRVGAAGHADAPGRVPADPWVHRI